ncbi:MAG: hypothetical protein K2X03_19170 [Bryobacteraceae bacterium]|nr:hypothetical protein [Bryobacteraceae bacterium]
MRKLAPLALLALLGAFGWGIALLLETRFGGGDIYPPGSSLRADRRGVRVLHDSLARLRPVSRNFNSLDAPDLSSVTIFILQNNVFELEEGDWQTYTKRGARVVFALTPVLMQKPPKELKALGLTLKYAKPTEEMLDTPAWESGRETTLSFAPSADWTQISPTVIERPFGKGAFVLAANADLFSNQTLTEERDSELLARIVGPARRIVFDETHLGVRDDPGVMVFVRRYGLVGLLLAFVALAALFLWQASFPLVPLAAEATALLELHSDRTTESGLSQLLRRGIPTSELLAVCGREWERFATPTPTQREAVRAALQERSDPVAAFRRAILALERKR